MTRTQKKLLKATAVNGNPWATRANIWNASTQRAIDTLVGLKLMRRIPGGIYALTDAGREAVS